MEGEHFVVSAWGMGSSGEQAGEGCFESSSQPGGLGLCSCLVPGPRVTRAPVLSQGRGFCTIFQQVFLRRDKPPTSLRFMASTEPQSSEASITQPHPKCPGPESSQSRTRP